MIAIAQSILIIHQTVPQLKLGEPDQSQKYISKKSVNISFYIIIE